MKTMRLPHDAANLRARSTDTYSSFVLATTMLGNGSGTRGIALKLRPSSG